jgi:2-C-methyl-D-erythritol 4-phosphate cytidylyltransferase
VKSKTPVSAHPSASFEVPPIIYAVIPAGGVGSRLGADRPKQYLPVFGRKTMLEMSAEALLERDWISKVVVVVAAEDGYQEAVYRRLKRRYGDRVEFLLEGGATRRDTVLSGLRHLLNGGGKALRAWVLVHDAARPGLDAMSLERLKVAVLEDPKKMGGLLALPITDTVKQVAETRRTKEARSAQTLDRRRLWAAQTPQMFSLKKLCAALQTFSEVTDEASAIEQAGGKPLLICGSAQNFKVTNADDLLLMRALLKAKR